ncbi:MAG: TonB-dependent receptor [Gammaproteobacteria bacterium]|nr:TonB-dependent receptor [Gammaproteobacteria bacterium]NNF50021.1 TonB-dependent receptor [Woeseiaceae bacterium]MBT8094760.1 TonB-dependent receptor [Gammaproteobacteria bacterium]MBT8106113.1 TonB-dependent receptor [Gammaproteobacteria bacterium]NNK26127.1 TonB-dependent receptor [Woeseiaceae bacterium]
MAAFMLLAGPVVSNAQETSSAVAGTVTDDNGNAVAGATVSIRNPATGLTRSTTTGADGSYTIRNLPIAQTYAITVGGEGRASERRDNVAVNLGSTTTENFALVAAGDMEEIVTIGTRQAVAQVAVGPNSSFDIEALETSPAINRNITDVIRADARIYVDESRGDINAVQCAGKNSRYNSLTVDGVRMNDGFGLNSNGYPTERMPFSYDAINQVSVELAPFDVIYGGFSACNLNAVTKSGGNEFSGSAFYDYTSDSLRSDKLEGDSITTGGYDEHRYGVTFGGPIIQDKLFFFVAAEKLDGANLFDRGPIGSGAVNEVQITQAELDQIREIASTVYQYDIGEIPSSRDHFDEKLLVKLDWNISDSQRLAFTYNWNDGQNWSQADSSSSNLEFEPHLYERGAELTSYVGTLYSEWTDRFSTELRLGYLELDNRQITVGGNDFGEIRIERLGPNGNRNVYIGGDDSRQSNKLKYDVTTLVLRGNYDLDNHALTFGYELEALDIFNLFIQHTETELRFNGLDDFENLFADDIYYNNSPAHNPNDAAAEWGYEVNTVYIQDEFQIGDRLTVVAGIRHDWYTTSDAPALNSEFESQYGFGNNLTLDGEGLTQPRIGFTFDWTDDTVLHGGIGIYSGGNPNVWLSNTYSNDNTRQFGGYLRDYDLTGETYTDCEPGVPEGPGWCIPQTIHDQVSTGTGSNFEINYLDPNFKIPSETKVALGVTHIFEGDWTMGADILYSRAKDPAMVKRGDFVEVGTNSDGYAIYDSGDRMGSFVLTNSNKNPESIVVSLGLEKEFENGFYFRVGYANTNSEDVQPMTSSVSFSNYSNRAFFSPNEDVVSTSNYEIKHRFSAAARWRKELARDTELTVAFYGHANSGRPYSNVLPFGPFDSGTPYPFQFFADENILAPGVARNGETGSWWRKIDARVTLDFPGFRDDHRASAFLVIDNLTNLLNDDWGVLYQHGFPRTVLPGDEEFRNGEASRYEIRLGVEYDF